MQNYYRYFPLSESVKSGDVVSLIVSIVIYVVACAVLGFLSKVLGWIFLVGFLLKLLFSLIGIYCCVGVILSVLKFFQPKGA